MASEVVDVPIQEDESKQEAVGEEESLTNYFGNMLSTMDMTDKSELSQRNRLEAFNKLSKRIRKDDPNILPDDPDLVKLKAAIQHGNRQDSQDAFEGIMHHVQNDAAAAEPHAAERADVLPAATAYHGEISDLEAAAQMVAVPKPVPENLRVALRSAQTAIAKKIFVGSDPEKGLRKPSRSARAGAVTEETIATAKGWYDEIDEFLTDLASKTDADLFQLVSEELWETRSDG
mgnify:FL=1